MIQVKTFYAHNDLRNYSYLIFDDQTGNSWVIDPYEAQPMIEYIRKNSLVLKGILNTHQHFDHIRGNTPLVETFKTSVKKLSNAENISLGDGHELETLDTPGHTLDHQVFIWKTQTKPLALFSGDTLFNAGVGNCKNGGDVNLLFETTQKLISTLPDETLLYPGHDYVQRNLEFALKFEPENIVAREVLKENEGIPAERRKAFKLGEEKKVNPFFRLSSEEIREQLSAQNASEKNVFKQLRALRDNW